MSELAELLKWAGSLLHEMLAHLSLIFLLELVELTLVSVKVIIVVLLGKMSENFTRRIVKVSWSAVSIIAFSFISLFLLGRLRGLIFSVLASRSRLLDEGGSSGLAVVILGGFSWGFWFLNFSGVDWLWFDLNLTFLLL